MPSKNKILEKAAHSPLGASNCERWWNCPGSVALIEKCKVKDVPSKYAAEGTVAHSVAADLILKLLGRENVAVKQGAVRTADGFEFMITEEMLSAVNVYVEHVTDLLYVHDLGAEYADVEQKIRIPHPDPDVSDLFGTTDLRLRVPYSRLIVEDYKHGAGQPVEAQNNKQLLYYAYGSYLSLPEDDRDNYPVIEMVIIQPRTPGDAIDSWEVATDEVIDFGAELLVRASATNDPDAPLNAGTWCKYCPAKVSCPALRETIQREAGLDFVNLPATISPYNLPTVDDYSPEQIANILAHKSMIEDFLDALHKHAFSMAERGIEIPGYHLVEKWGHRKWNESAFLAVYSSQLGDSEMFDMKLKSPAQMEKVFKQAKLDPKVINDYTTKESLGKALAPVTDKRKPAAPKAIDDFKDVEILDMKDVKIDELQRKLDRKADAEPRWESGSVPDFTDWS